MEDKKTVEKNEKEKNTMITTETPQSHRETEISLGVGGRVNVSNHLFLSLSLSLSLFRCLSTIWRRLSHILDTVFVATIDTVVVTVVVVVTLVVVVIVTIVSCL